MEIIKKGSKGDAVKALLKALLLTAIDGDFGDNTEKALIAFQKSKGLTTDGVCGPNTWKALGVVEDSKCIDSSVIFKPLSVHVTKSANRPIKYLVIHFTAGSNSKPGRAQGMYNTFTQRAASADFGVDDRDIVQFNPDIKNYYCWAVGGKPYGNKGGQLYGKATNSNCISIEMCSTCTPSTTQGVTVDNHKGWSISDPVLENTRKLAKIIMKKYNIDIDHVIRHYDITGKLCPGVVGWNNEPIKDLTGKKTSECSNSMKWNAFKNSLI